MKTYNLLIALYTIFILSSCANKSTTMNKQQAAKSQAIILSSEAALIGMQLAMKKGFENGKASQSLYQCILDLDPSSFNSVVESFMIKNFTSDEQIKLEEFLKSPYGIKYSKHDLSTIYSIAGVPNPEPLPFISFLEKQNIEEFSKTPAGDKWIRKNFVKTQIETDMQLKVMELMAACRGHL